jgi:hypothetical protein
VAKPEHVVGIHIVGSRSPRMPGYVQAVCDTCGWKGGLHLRDKDPSVRIAAGEAAQREAIEHQGGTLRVRERVFRKRPPHEEMNEMFPGAK